MIALKEHAAAIERFFAARLELVKPELSRMTVSEWAEKKRVLPRGTSSLAGPFRWSVTPYLKEIADCFSESSPVQMVAVMKGARVGCTVGVIENALGYLIDQAPCPILMVGADKESSEQGVEQRVDAMLVSAGLQGRIFSQVDKKNNRRTGDTRALKQFPGGSLRAIGPSVAAKLRSFGVKVIFFDECDSYGQDVQGEGDPITLAIRRSDEYERNRKVAFISTPLDDETSKIKERFLAGTQEYYEVPCPSCGHYQRLEWKDKDGSYRLKYETR